MDEPNSFSSTYNHSTSPPISQPRTPLTNSSGLTLVLPSLKALKSSKNGKKAGKHRSGSAFSAGFQDNEAAEKRPARLLKLKPLKEVLIKLISQIKKKDDYAFFLRPVDPEQVPGYSDVVKHPMDLGTMTTKVERGKYRSLEDFTSDLKLVTTNAKTFNPPGSIYFAEAERIEAWALDHIAKAALTVIQYETDWNIDVERDDESHTVDIDNDDDGSMDVDSVHEGRSASVVSQPAAGSSRRGPRGAVHKKQSAAGVSESIEPDGHLPGAKDGLGVFPPGSDWARTMLQLKLKGKRYRTKKERLRVEKEGPPVLPDGSLDYTEMEDPFSVLSCFVPDPPTRPYLTPLHAPRATTSSQTQQSSEPSTPLSRPPRSTFPTATAAPLTYTFSLSQVASAPASNLKRKYWTITRNLVSRNKGKEKEDEAESGDIPTWQTPQEAHATDFGTFALLAGELAQEAQRRGISSGQGTASDEERDMLDAIRNGLDCETSAKAAGNAPTSESTTGTEASNTALFYPKDYWSLKRAAEAETYLRDVVYGGVDGLAYIRSLAEFVTSYESEDSPTSYRTHTVFGVPLAKWVDREIVQPLTDGRHALLHLTAEQLLCSSSSKTPPDHLLLISKNQPRTVAEQIYLSLHVYPAAMIALSALLQIATHKIDMSALIKTPEELFQSEEEWVGKVLKERREKANVAEEDAVPDEMEVEELPPNTTDAASQQINNTESIEDMKEVVNYIADVIAGQDQKLRKVLLANGETRGKTEEEAEDPTLRNIRLNLLALAKRAPLDTIARLPKDLVPEHIRRFVPTLGET